MAIPRNLANLANQLNTDGEVPKIEVGDSKVEVTDTGSNGKITGTADGTAVFSVEKGKTFVLQGGASSTGVGIAFPADQTTVGASTDANTLDDYEEGTWTPTYVPETGSFTSITYQGFTEGTYVKIGKTCFIRGQMATTSLTVGVSSGTNLQIGGLPFAGVNVTWIMCNSVSGLWSGEIPFAANIAGSSRMTLYYRTAVDNAVVNSVVGDLSTGGNNNYLQFSGVYEVS